MCIRDRLTPADGEFREWDRLASAARKALVDDGYVSEPLYERVLSILEKIGQVISRIVRSIELVEEWLLVLLLFGMIAIAASKVILRNVFDMGLFWGDGSVRV